MKSFLPRTSYSDGFLFFAALHINVATSSISRVLNNSDELVFRSDFRLKISYTNNSIKPYGKSSSYIILLSLLSFLCDLSLYRKLAADSLKLDASRC